MPQLKIPALVLLGCRGAGKDTLCSLISKRNPDKRVANVKFSHFTKGLVADALQVPFSQWEDKQWRTTPVSDLTGDLTPLDLLDSLFHATETHSESGSRLKTANVLYTVGRLKHTQPDLAVFTDVRRLHEAQAVLTHFSNVTALMLHRAGAVVSKTDHHVSECAVHLQASHLRVPALETPDQTYNRLKEFLCNLN